MDNNITQLIDIKDAGIKVVSVKETTTSKIITIEKELTYHFCDLCGCRMHSKGIYTRHANHPIMQDGLSLILDVRQRRWICSNPACKNTETEKFSFLEKRRRNTNLSDFLIVNAFRNPEKSAADIAREHNVSDTHAIRVFARYVDMHRRNLPEAICIDEVYLNIHDGYKYALVIQDFVTGESVDLVETRRKIVTEPYFQSIPLKEREKVKYVISDMYKPYIEITKTFFPNAVSIVDAFHVIQAINRELLKHIRSVLRELHKRDEEEHEKREQEFHRRLDFRHSKEYLLFKHYYWMILKNGKDLKIITQPKYNKYLGRTMTTYDYFEWMYKVDPALKELRELKEDYIFFNTKYAGNPAGARNALPEMINTYRNSKYAMYHSIADMLQEHFDEIINSFVLLEKQNGDKVRLSNGPIESLNRIIKDIKRIGRGYQNFEYVRNRFLFATRKNAKILGVPRNLEDTYLKAYIAGETAEKVPYEEDVEDDFAAADDYDFMEEQE